MKSLKSWYLAIPGILLAIACSSGIDGTGDEGSEVKIVNGQQDSGDQFPNVILLTVKTTRTFFFSSTSEYCTGVITDSATVLAAAHCVKNLPNKTQPDVYHGIVANFQNRTITASSGFAFPETIDNKDIREEHVGLDLVVIKFPVGSFTLPQEKFAKLPDAATLEKVSPRTSKVFLVGYGATTFGATTGRFNPNTRNFGENILGSKTDRGYYTVSGSAQDKSKALANRGDSGGPLFLEDKVTLLGIGSALKINGDEVTNYFTDLSSAQSQALLKFSSGQIDSTAFNSTPRFDAKGAELFIAMCSSSDKGGGNKSTVADLPVSSGRSLIASPSP